MTPKCHPAKRDTSRAFRNLPVDPRDSIHLSMKWKDKYYIDKFLAFGAVHGMRIFQRITNFVRFILAQEGISVYNYIDDIYACCHTDHAHFAFQRLKEVILNIGLLINPEKIFPPLSILSVIGIVIDIEQDTFSIEPKKFLARFYVQTRVSIFAWQTTVHLTLRQIF